MRRPHHRAPLRTTVLFHGALHPYGLFQSVLMGLDASYTGHEAKYPSVSRFEVFIAGLAILSSAHLSLLRTALRFNGKSRKTIGGIDANRFHSLCFPSISLLFFYYFFFFFSIIRIFGSKFLFVAFVSCGSFLVGGVFVYFWKEVKGNERLLKRIFLR